MAFRFRFFIRVIACLTASGLAGLAQTDATSERVIDLPPLMVEEAATPLRWRHVEFEGIEMLSVVSDGATRAFLRRHHNQSEILKWMLPEKYQGKSSVPDEYILFNEEIGRARSQEVINSMMKHQRDQARRKREKEKEKSGPSGWNRSRNEPRIRFLPNLRLNDADTTAVFVVVRESDSLASSFNFTLDRVAHLLLSRVPALPGWFTFGMAGLYERAAINDEQIVFRTATWTTPAALTALQSNPEPLRTLLSMEELFSGRPARGRLPTEFDRIWRVQCALFLRWAIAEEKGARREALWAFLDRLEKEPLSEALFQEHFGVGYADMRDILSDYLLTAVDQQVTLRGPKIAKAPAIALRDASPLDIARIRGDWERIQIAFVRKTYPAVVDKYIEQARRTLRKPYDLGERDPRLLALLGLLECDADNRDAAQPFLEAALQARVARPRVYYELALTRYTEAIAHLEEKDRGLTREQIAGISAPLDIARLFLPPLPGAYAILSDIWLRTHEEIPAATLDALNQAVALFPHIEGITLRVARLNVLNGDYARAEAQLRGALPFASNQAVREAIEKDIAAFSRLRPPAEDGRLAHE